MAEFFKKIISNKKLAVCLAAVCIVVIAGVIFLIHNAMSNKGVATVKNESSVPASSTYTSGTLSVSSNVSGVASGSSGSSSEASASDRSDANNSHGSKTSSGKSNTSSGNTTSETNDAYLKLSGNIQVNVFPTSQLLINALKATNDKLQLTNVDFKTFKQTSYDNSNSSAPGVTYTIQSDALGGLTIECYCNQNKQNISCGFKYTDSSDSMKYPNDQLNFTKLFIQTVAKSNYNQYKTQIESYLNRDHMIYSKIFGKKVLSIGTFNLVVNNTIEQGSGNGHYYGEIDIDNYQNWDYFKYEKDQY